MDEPVELMFRGLPNRADGLRIVHLSDPHIHSLASARRLSLSKLASRKIDLVLLTGDYMVRGGSIEPPLQWLTEITQTLKPRHGFHGIFGNHDESDLRQRAASLPIHWLDDGLQILPELGVALGGLSTRCGAFEAHSDMSHLIMQIGRARREGTLTPDMFTIILAHVPTASGFVEATGVNWVLSGHTHGGQVRLPHGWSPVDLGMPTGYNAGLFRLRDLIVTVSRGMGGRPWMPRVFCPPQVPVYTLHQGPTPGEHSGTLNCIKPW